jgi:hypothetical protein
MTVHQQNFLPKEYASRSKKRGSCSP